ncbi:MAG: 23S rRNA (pseudouridine(1915)-N(3))-methyltransferase RlmH [Clostridia bacterium]|nr:23S rRNA (pseudouridine(1915)-N(3))-methyltransferase RlmH [Clostridia bacterium]
MLRVKIICVGKLKERYWSAAVEEYLKRLNAFCKVEIKEIAEVRLPDNPSAAQIEEGLQKEGQKILAEIPAGAYTYCLQIEGKQMSSETLARQMAELGVAGKSTVVFIIGSSFGLAGSVKQRGDCALSFSKMTFPHQLARVMLLEQIYRAFSIGAGTKYHK